MSSKDLSGKMGVVVRRDVTHIEREVVLRFWAEIDTQSGVLDSDAGDHDCLVVDIGSCRGLFGNAENSVGKLRDVVIGSEGLWG